MGRAQRGRPRRGWGGYRGRRRRRFMNWTTTLLFGLSALVAAGIPGCGMWDNKECDKGQSRWKCMVQPTACHMAYPNFQCASNMQDAIDKANNEAILVLKLRDQTIIGTTCEDTGSPKRGAQGIPPPSCDETTGDNTCVACAKANCCEDYQACEQDQNCICWVVCKAGGNADD